MTPPLPNPDLNRAAGLLDAAAAAEAPLANPAISLRCLSVLAHLRAAGAQPDTLTISADRDARAAAIRNALQLLAQLPPALFDTDHVLDAVREATLAHEATG